MLWQLSHLQGNMRHIICSIILAAAHVAQGTPLSALQHHSPEARQAPATNFTDYLYTYVPSPLSPM